MVTHAHPPLYATSPRPYYIVAPAYRQNSAGIRVMHMLCHLLNRCGQDAYLYPTQTNPLWHTPLLTDELERQHAQAGRQPIVVYPEVVPGNPANSPSVVRYLLNVPGLLGGDTEFPDSEMIFAYGQHLLPEGVGTERLLFLPPIDTSIFNNRDNPYDTHRKGCLIYPGRYADALKNHPELAARCTVITHEWPATRQEMADMFRRSERVYCFASTSIAMEAMLCGCPVVVLRSPFFDGVPLSVDEFGTYGLAFEDTPQAIEQARQGLITVQEKYLALQNRFWDQLARFIELTQAMPCSAPSVGGSTEVSAGPGSLQVDTQAIERWLRQRSPSDIQVTLMARRLEEHQHDLPRFDFIILPGRQPGAAEVTRQSLLTQSYQHIEVHLPADGEAATLNDLVMQRGAGQWVCFVRAGTTFTSFGLLMLALELLGASGVRAVYADEVSVSSTGELSTLLRPDFNLDMFLSCPGKMARHWFYRRDVFLEAGGFDPDCVGAIELGLLLHLIEDADGLDGLAHVSEPVFISPQPDALHSPQEQAVLTRHLHRRGYFQARVQMHRPGIHRIHYGHGDTPRVTVAIAVGSGLERTQRCVTSVMEKTIYPHFEILLVDNDSSDLATRAWLDGLKAQEVPGIRVLRDAGRLNRAAASNLAARHASGDYLVLLHSDAVIVQGDWLEALLNHAQRPEVGVVGAKLLHPNGTVEQAGLVLGLEGPARSAFSSLADNEGYMQRLEMDQNYSAVSDACLMIRRELYEALGGMDSPQFKDSYADIDLCLKSGQAGYLTVWTPHAVVVFEGKGIPSAEVEQDALYSKWLPLIASDPAYNRSLSLRGEGFTLEADPGLAWNPLSWRPLPVVLAMPGNLEGNGLRRIIDPALSMSVAGMADIRLGLRDYLPAELERLQPDAWIMQPPTAGGQLDVLRRSARFTNAIKVADVSAADFRAELQVGAGALQRFIALSDRLVVPTDALAEALRGSSQQVCVLPDRLHPSRWGAVANQRNRGSRPRVGWVGGAVDEAMQALMMELIQVLHLEVDWVCLGHCPEPIQPYMRELHNAVPFDEYPQKLASLALDVALAPLGEGLSNEGYSNLRLLEFGACGYPVICSDVPSYQDLPVTRVKNEVVAWIEAIRMHLAEPGMTASNAASLRQTVLDQWMLDEHHMQQWLKTWLEG